ncbi:MAG: KH domain-containing protein [Candidatus Thermoplasmatota archaeon]
MRYLRIPKERIGVLIGPNGEIKKQIEQRSQTKIEIDSNEGEICIDDHETHDQLSILKAEDVIKAIGRGFSPERAMLLFQEENEFFLFDIYDYGGKKETHITRLKSRIIGREGKTKKTIEQLTDAQISIYGHTVAVISHFETMDLVKRAIDMLLSGSEHQTVYRFLEREMKKLRLGLV